MATTMIRQRQAILVRWQAALYRAVREGVEVHQLVDSGAWIATSGSDAGTAYGLAVTGGMAHGCDCPAAPPSTTRSERSTRIRHQHPGGATLRLSDVRGKRHRADSGRG